ncbi:lipopolysaccharide biosynthesis protein, partial [Desulfovibrio sp. OttesenSCG-928-F20]|nr:lipopolysaccharide biosynthesis protein [Desulfovibrio sp. OttesenSCG-928-F20]
GLPPLDRKKKTAYARQFWDYSAPLCVTALCSALALSGERWLLQFFDGSVEQGFFSLSQRIGVACFLFVTAMTPLFMREMAMAHGSRDPLRMAALLDRYAPMIYAVAAWMACFVFIEARGVAGLFGGADFADAALPVQIMALYPIHQGYGQVAGAVYYASGQTRALRNITLAGLVLGLVAAWLFVAPDAYGGLGLGATGLAVKMVLVQFLTVNALLLACRKTAPFNFARNLAHQFVCPLIFGALALAARLASQGLPLQEEGPLRLLIAGILYCLLCLIPAWFFPFALGLKRGEASAQAARLGRWWRGRMRRH